MSSDQHLRRFPHTQALDNHHSALFMNSIFLDSTLQWELIVFVFLCRTYFTKYNALRVHSWVTKGRVSFFMAEYYSFVYEYHIFFFHLSMDGHWDCVHVLGVVNDAAVNMRVEIISLREWFDLYYVFSEMGLLNHMEVLFFIFWENSLFRLCF